MSAKNIIVLISIMLFRLNLIQAQNQTTINDSLWCDHLNEIIKCASIDEITERIAKGVTDSSYIPTIIPALKLTESPHEWIKKEYGKVSYECYLRDENKNREPIEQQYNRWYKKIKSCLSLWEEARLKNGDATLSVPDDYFFTNSEDETAVRLDVVKDNDYRVRLRIY